MPGCVTQGGRAAIRPLRDFAYQAAPPAGYTVYRSTIIIGVQK